jgi:tRNA A-37 threonylcarbamoyl transferase component Bud32
LAAPAPAELAPHFPQLEILELLGQGGMGAVYKARQPKLDRLVALKILPAEAGADAHFAERFNREARALARLDHPNIVRVHDFGESGGFHYFIMEYVEGVNLRQLMRAGDLKPEQTLQLIPQICEALQYAHDEGIVHRDIKPENILLDKKGRVKIADFGLAKLLARTPADFTLTATHQVMGTPHYMAPEQMDKPLTVDHRADIYSLGVVLYEMLTGELPLGRFAPPSQKAPVDARLDAIVFRALAREPEWRYQHVREVQTDLESIGPAMPALSLGAELEHPAKVKLDLELIRMQVSGPAAALEMVGGLGFFLDLLCWIGLLAAVSILKDTRSGGIHWGDAALGFWSLGFILLPMAVMIWQSRLVKGARQMREFKDYGSVMASTYWAMLPWSPAFVLGLPIGIWALRVLQDRKVKAAFAQQASLAAKLQPTETIVSSTPKSTGPIRRKGRSLLQSIFSLVFWSRAKNSSSSLSQKADLKETMPGMPTELEPRNQ